MFKLTKAAFVTVCLSLLAMLNQAKGDVEVFFDAGTINSTESLTGFNTTGADMDLMTVTATFSDGYSETVFWAATDADSGEADGDDWYVKESGTTYSNH